MSAGVANNGIPQRDMLFIFRRYALPILTDAVLVGAAYIAALFLRFDSIPQEYLQTLRVFMLPIAAVYCLTNVAFGLYERLWRYASSTEATGILGAVGLAGLLLLVSDALFTIRPVPLSVVIMGSIFAAGFFAATRYRWRLVTGFLWRLRRIRQGAGGNRVLIIGAGEAGQLMAWRLKNWAAQMYEVVGFVDDDPQKLGMQVHGVKVLGNRSRIKDIVDSGNVNTIVIAMHRVSGADFREILSMCEETSAKIQIEPEILETVNGQDGQLRLRDITVEDLVGRKAVPVDAQACQRLVTGKTVLVTGAAGSIGSELSRQVAHYNPRMLLLLDNNESGLYDLGLEIGLLPNKVPFRLLVRDILQENRLEDIFKEQQPDLIFHCAAYKHVPLMEEHADAAVLVNVEGTRILCDLAYKYQAERFVLISTDKAVEPESVMGATKRVGEMITVTMPRDGATRFAAVRFGNVLNSRGSVVPTFVKQIERGGPVTVTHPEMTRYFMGLLEAVSLIIQAACFTKGGDIFVLDMGETIRIVDLARRIIRLRGLRVGEDIQIRYTGPRPGEKMSESLVASHRETMAPTAHPSIREVRANDYPSRTALLQEARALVETARTDGQRAVIERLMRLVGKPTADTASTVRIS
ncbi:MAG: nucleoside-diphosphate sugar epimerase/dehydratase [Dehalococcoidia bacterium]|nr:nucleoside-diphosphate sugar epimerase/dehydratase [Dehalococcoidia bacterium]